MPNPTGNGNGGNVAGGPPSIPATFTVVDIAGREPVAVSEETLLTDYKDGGRQGRVRAVDATTWAQFLVAKAEYDRLLGLITNTQLKVKLRVVAEVDTDA